MVDKSINRTPFSVEHKHRRNSRDVTKSCRDFGVAGDHKVLGRVPVEKPLQPGTAIIEPGKGFELVDCDDGEVLLRKCVPQLG